MECGCKHGHSTMIIAETLRDQSYMGELHVFDSFEGGLSDKDANDRVGLGDTSGSATLKQKQHFSSSLSKFQRTFADYEFMKIYPGWLPDTLLQLDQANKYALIHIDVDLYLPIKGCLEYFYPRLTEGGILVIDDYGSAVFPGAKKAVDEFFDNNGCSIFLENNVGGCIIIK